MKDFPATLSTPTRLLDFESAEIQQLVTLRGWRNLPQYEAIGAVYDYVRNEIAFGYNRTDNIPASEVMRDGFGQCNTKATLLMALLQALNIPCRLHGSTIRKALQRGVVPELAYGIAPNNNVHTWGEGFYSGRWINLEGFILDEAYLAQMQKAFSAKTGLLGFGVGTENLAAPKVRWEGQDTKIQSTGINNDYGVFDTPDAFYSRYQQNFSYLKEKLFRFVIRHWMNARVARFRRGAAVKQNFIN
jgi:hypothetical protein